MTCKISVVMPAYNCSAFIREAMYSVLNQSDNDLELIVINDGSTDNTLEIIESVAITDSRVKVISQSNAGKPSIVRNKGLGLATGKYISFLDGDDLFIDGKLQETRKLLECYSDVDMVFHDVRLIDNYGLEQDGTYLESVEFNKNVLSASQKLDEDVYLCNWKELFYFMCTRVTTIYTSALLIRRERLFREEIYFPENLTIGEDIDLWFRIVKGGNVAFINKPLSSYRIYSQSITHSPGRNLYDSIISHVLNYKKRAGFLSFWQRKAYRKRIALDMFNAGYYYNGQGRNMEAILLFLRSILWSFDKAPIKQIVKAVGMLLFRRV